MISAADYVCTRADNAFSGLQVWILQPALILAASAKFVIH
jgi:hypothetical protein